jgi:hypothetical protein
MLKGLGCMGDSPTPSSVWIAMCPGQWGQYRDRCCLAT